MLPTDWPLQNVWLGVTAENQHWADKRMPILRKIPIHPDSLRFVCAEPLLSAINFTGPSSLQGYGWVTAGGESGDRKHPPRPAKDQWFLDMAAQCRAALVPFFLMQRGGISKCRCHHDFGCRAIPPGPNGQVFEGFPPQVQIISP
jgi:protein gp37